MDLYDQWQYIFEFTDEEWMKIRREADLVDFRILYAILAGVLTFLAVFASQLPWLGQEHLIHLYATYGSLPAGIAVGCLTPHWLKRHVYKRWRDVWHPLARELRASSPSRPGGHPRSARSSIAGSWSSPRATARSFSSSPA